VRVLQPSGRVAKTSLYQPFHRPHRKITSTSVPGEPFTCRFGGYVREFFRPDEGVRSGGSSRSRKAQVPDCRAGHGARQARASPLPERITLVHGLATIAGIAERAVTMAWHRRRTAPTDVAVLLVDSYSCRMGKTIRQSELRNNNAEIGLPRGSSSP